MEKLKICTLKLVLRLFEEREFGFMAINAWKIFNQFWRELLFIKMQKYNGVATNKFQHMVIKA